MSLRRGRIGLIKPTHRPKSFAFWYRNLPPDVECVPTFIGFRTGTRETFTAEVALRRTEELAADLCAVNCSIISISGSPPFLLRGVAFEREWGQSLARRIGIPVVTPMQPHAAALQALRVRRVAVATYYRDELNDAIARYFSAFEIDSAVIPGFSASAQPEGLYATPLMALDDVASEQVYLHCTEGVRRLRGRIDGLYINGGGWDVAPVIEQLERDLGIPVIWALAAELWLTLRLMGVDDAIPGCGLLLRDSTFGVPAHLPD